MGDQCWAVREEKPPNQSTYPVAPARVQADPLEKPPKPDSILSLTGPYDVTPTILDGSPLDTPGQRSQGNPTKAGFPVLRVSAQAKRDTL